MKWKEIFSKLLFWRKENKTKQVYEWFCDDDRIGILIREWSQEEGLKLSDFAYFLKSMGLCTPVTLQDFIEECNSFKCVTASGRKVEILLSFNSEIAIKEGEETRKYSIEIEHGKLKLNLQSREICRDGKILNSYYCKIFCNRTLIIDDTHELVVNFSEPNSSEDKSMIAVLQNCDKVEEYLIGLDNSLCVDDVYDEVLRMLHFSDKELNSSDEIVISYNEAMFGKKVARAEISMFRGKLKGYAYIDEGQTYYVSRYGDCEYISGNGIIVSYNVCTNVISFEWIDTSRELLEEKDINELIKNVIETFDNFYIDNKEFFS